MNCLHLLRKSTHERVDGGTGKTRDAHAQYAQACELRYEPAHELPRTGAQVESAQSRTRAQELHDGAKEGQIVVMPDGRKAEGLEMRQQHVRRRIRHERRARQQVVRIKDGRGRRGLVESPVQGEREEVVRVGYAREDYVGYARVDELEVGEVLDC